MSIDLEELERLQEKERKWGMIAWLIVKVLVIGTLVSAPIAFLVDQIVLWLLPSLLGK